MQVILLATDEAPELRPLTDTIPSPLVPIVNRPVIGVAMEILARTGFKHVTVSLCNRGGAIASYLGDGGRWGVTVKYAVQREALGNAGAIRWAAEHLNETILVLPADAVLDLDIEAALAYHRAHGCPATLILHEPASGPIDQPVRIDVDGQLLPADDRSLNSQAMWHTGAYIFEPAVVQRIPAHTRYDVFTQLIPDLVRGGLARGYVTEGYWNPLRTFSAYQEAQRIFLYSAYVPAETPETFYRPQLPRVRFPSIEGQQIAPGIWIGHNHAIHPGARLAAPICLGADCHIGYGVDLGPEVVIGSHVVVDEDATIARSVVLKETYVGPLVNVENRVVNQTTMIDMYSGETTTIVDPFLLAPLPLEASFDGVRRALSVAGALLLIGLTLPLVVAIALLVIVTSGPRVVVRQARVGRRPAQRQQGAAADTIGLLGFRTRRADGSFTLLGQWLEKWELNHIPALWNVIRGDLNLVGIKPLLPREAAYAVEDWQQRRNECPAGLIGLWFVQEDCDGNLDATLVADAYYVATRSWKLDLQLLLQAPRSWLRRCRRPVDDAQLVLSAVQERTI